MQEQVRQITTIYCLCDDFLHAWDYKDAPQAKMTTAQVMTIALVAVKLFDGNQERSRCFLQEHGYIPNMLSKGAFNRRLHEIPDTLWQALFGLLADVHKQMNQSQEYNESQEYAVDSLPVPVCDNIRLCRCRLYPCPKPDKQPKNQDKQPKNQDKQPQTGEGFRGYIASKKRYFSRNATSD